MRPSTATIWLLRREVLDHGARYLHCTSPYSINRPINASAMLRGTAKPVRVSPPAGAMIAVSMSTSRPRSVTRPPPELPGLIDTSVWLKPSLASPSRLLRSGAGMPT